MSRKHKGMNYRLKALRLELDISRKDLDWYRRNNKDVELDQIKQTIVDDE